MKIFAIVVLSVFVLLACNKDTHLSRKEMEKVLLDINLAEGYSTVVKDSLHRNGLKNIDSLGNYYADIFKHNNITKEQFIENMEWYKNHCEELDSVYNRLITDITKMQTQQSLLKK